MDTRPGRLYTWGYRGLRLADLTDVLPPATLVLDIRANPWSPDPRWQSGPLRAALRDLGLHYRHVPELGNSAYRTGGITIADPTMALVVVERLRAGRDVCLLCACPDVADCHRSEVARLIVSADPSIDVTHIESRAFREGGSAT